MDDIHRLLNRQIQKYLGENYMDQASEDMKKFFLAVSHAYVDYEDDTHLLERSIEISSREYNDSLNKINALHEQLIQNEKMASVGQLSAGVAHEINNPLAFVLSNMDTLSKYFAKMKGFYDFQDNLVFSSQYAKENVEDYEKACDQLKQYIKANKIHIIYDDAKDIIDESLLGLQRIEKIVKSLLSFSRKISSNEFVSIDMNKVVRDTLLVVNNELKYHTEVDESYGDVPVIMAMEGEINQVLLNLIINAAYATKERGIPGKIRIRTYADEKYVICEISDNGTGIAPENLKRIFEPFFTTKPVGTGTGLGLSIAHDIIVNKHSGKLTVESELNKGTTFSIMLPIGMKEFG